MPRWIAVGLLMAAPSLAACAELPVIAPQVDGELPPAAQPVAPAPTTASSSGAWAVSCQPASAYVESCPTRVKKPGVLTGLKNWLCGTTPVDACGTACAIPTSPVFVHQVCPAPSACAMPAYSKPIIPNYLPVRPTIACPAVEVSPSRRFGCVGTACEKFKNLLFWKPCNEQILPAFRPAPYRAPAYAYLGPSREPTPGLTCGTCRKTATTNCATGACAAVESNIVGPVVGAKPHPVMGAWTPINANYPATTTVVPAKPVDQSNPLARPFTMP